MVMMMMMMMRMMRMVMMSFLYSLFIPKAALQDLIIVSLSIYLAALVPATLMFLGSRIIRNLLPCLPSGYEVGHPANHPGCLKSLLDSAVVLLYITVWRCKKRNVSKLWGCPFWFLGAYTNLHTLDIQTPPEKIFGPLNTSWEGL